MSWMVNPYDERVFIKNNGQFTKLESELGCVIRYCFEQGNTAFFLCTDRIVVQLREPSDNSNEGYEQEDPATGNYPAPSFTYLPFSFRSPSSTVAIYGEEPSSPIHKYFWPDASGKNTLIEAPVFSKVIYKNFYEGIDVIFTPHEKNGLKYQYVLHPFADASLIGLSYTGDGSISLDDSGNIHAGIEGNEIVDHAPQTFYDEDHSPIPSSFVVNGNSFSIDIGEYNHSKTIIIDPWITDPDFADQNKAFDIAGDADGNVYVFGGHSNWQLKKFTPAGSPIWTFDSPMDEWYGALAVDPSGNSIITEGCCSGNIIKVDSTGDVAWSLVNGVDEYWRLDYNCDYSRLYLAVAYASSPGLLFESLCLLDTATGDISNSTVIFPGQQTEPRALAVGMDGNMYTISCSGYQASNEVAALDPSFSIIFSETSGYNLLYNGPLYTNGINSTAGQNAVSAGNNFLCTSNGSTLFKRDRNNGDYIASATIPGGVAESNSGILVDSCDNIFIGAADAVIKYDSFLNVISTTPTTGAVYCLAPSMSGNLLVCGNGFIASMDLDVCRNIFCMDANPDPLTGIVASATEVCQKFCVNYFDSTSSNAASWQWIFPGGSPSSSTLQNPVNICYDVPGVYDVTLITTGPNGSDTLIKENYITVYSTPPFPSITQNGYMLTSTPAVSYQWQLNSIDIPGATDQSYSVLLTGYYTVVVADEHGCKNSATTYVAISGIENVSANSGVNIFPNPSNKEIVIKSLVIPLNVPSTVSLINVLGEIMLTEKVSWSDLVTLDIEMLPSGIYMLSVESDVRKLSSRFVKE